jgi:hypothetical protein
LRRGNPPISIIKLIAGSTKSVYAIPLLMLCNEQIVA